MKEEKEIKTFVFTYEITGRGVTENDALNDALDSFVVDPGEPDIIREEVTWREG